MNESSYERVQSKFPSQDARFFQNKLTKVSFSSFHSVQIIDVYMISEFVEICDVEAGVGVDSIRESKRN